MTKVNDLGPKTAFDVQIKDIANNVQHNPLISNGVISKSKIGNAENPSLASKKIKTPAKAENNTQTLWKVAAVVMLAASSIFLWQSTSGNAAVIKAPNPFADPVCLIGDENLGKICQINDLAHSNLATTSRYTSNPFADTTCLDALRNMCPINDLAESKVDAALRRTPNPFDPICLKTDESICQVNDQVKIVTENNPFHPLCPNLGKTVKTMCFDENDLEEIVTCTHEMDKLQVKIAAKDKNLIDDFSNKYRLTGSICYPFVGMSGERAEAITASTALAEDFVNVGKYDEAFLVINQANPNGPLRIKFLEMETLEKLLALLKSIATKSTTFPIQFMALEKMLSVGDIYPGIRQRLWEIRLSVCEKLFEKGFLSESLRLLTELNESNHNLEAKRSLAKKIALATSDENVRLKALNYKKEIVNPFPICIEIAKSLFIKGKINEAFNALDVAFDDSNIFHPNVSYRQLALNLIIDQNLPYSRQQYGSDRVQSAEILYASLDKVIKTFVAKKELTQAQDILDQLATRESRYYLTPMYAPLLGQARLDTLINHVKSGTT